MTRTDLDALHGNAAAYFRGLQDSICKDLERIEARGLNGRRFLEDTWQHPSGGGGITRVLTNGSVFEKAGVNFSQVNGTLTEEVAAQTPGKSAVFCAAGLSLVLHPRNPNIPAVHANFRHITKGSDPERVSWFGGGSDLTPFYPRREDVIHFHRIWKQVCERHSVADYTRFKNWCDQYFYLPHRGEARGVGGIFFDYLRERLDEVFAFVRDAGDQFLSAYVPILERRKDEPYTEAQRQWQLLRRGRYVEFNLLYDRGTAFGLKTGGRVESIFMSLPPEVRWEYNEHPVPGTAEADLLDYLKPRDWASEPD
jgi:coproporphyrinogen III oxidase